MLKIGTLLGNRYEIIEKIGAGGMSIVYKAKDIKLGRIVTVKVLRDEFITDEEFVSRFRVEAQAAASLSHNNIVNVYDVGMEYDTYYIVMEYINGCTLKDIILKEAPFSNQKTLDYAIKIASALQHAHKNHIVHRDIKPQNILVTESGGLKVTDFGIAHAATSSTVTMTTTAIGSVHYFSPEQARGGYVDEKSDLYSLGIVMYEMITGKLPFEGDSSVSIALKHIQEDLPDISTINPNVTKSIEGIILKATQKRAELRYKDVDAMIEDMLKALVDPTGSFIENTEVKVAESPTQKMSESDLKTIRDETKKDTLDELYKKEELKGAIEEEIDELDEEDEEDLDSGEELKVMIAAVATALAIIAIIFLIGYNTWFKDAIGNNQNQTEQTNSKQTVPSLLGYSTEDAEKLLKGLNIVLEIKEQVENEQYDVGEIISQEPVAGTKLEAGEKVVVVISAGLEKLEIPNLKNMNLYVAEETVAGKFIIVPRYEHHDTVEVLNIISQEPDEGEMYTIGTKIEVIVSSGPGVKTVIVPNILNKTESEAVSLLQDTGLIPGTISYDESETIEKGRVISQTIRSGKEATTSDVVAFTVSKGKPVETTEPTTPETTEPTTVAQGITGKERTINYVLTREDLGITELREQTEVVMYKDDEVVYRGLHKGSDFPVKIEVKGEGKAIIQIYTVVKDMYILKRETTVIFE